jgi:hypothetical protein
VRTTIVKTDEITLELLARTTFELKRLEKYKDKNEFDLIPIAYGFLGFCKAELENASARIARYNAHHSEGTEASATWKEIRAITKQTRNEMLVKFFNENDYWRRLLYPDHEIRARSQARRDATENQIKKELSTIDPLVLNERGIPLIDIAGGKLWELRTRSVVEWSKKNCGHMLLPKRKLQDLETVFKEWSAQYIIKTRQAGGVQRAAQRKLEKKLVAGR